MAIFAPSRANMLAISLPIPLAAPVTIATLSLRRMPLPIPKRDRSSSRIVAHDFPRPSVRWWYSYATKAHSVARSALLAASLAFFDMRNHSKTLRLLQR